MALNEKRKEQVQPQWPSRFASERLDLSASVSETPGNHSSEEEQGDLTGQGSSVHGVRGSTVFPPRLSLQSRAMPAVQPESPDATVASISFEIDFEEEEKSAGEEEELEADDTGRNANFFTRFAQRLTSSLAAFGGTMHAETGPALPSAASDESRHPSMQRELSLLLPTIEAARLQEGAEQKQALDQAEQLRMEGPLVRVLKDPEPNLTSKKKAADASTSSQSKQRLAGHAPKVRLETAPIPATPRLTKTTERSSIPHRSQALQGVNADSHPAFDVPSVEMSTTAIPLPAADTFLEDNYAGNATSARQPSIEPPNAAREMIDARLLIDASYSAANPAQTYPPAAQPLQEERGTTSVHLPVVNTVNGAMSAASRGTLAGSGVFESGQGDVTVMNPGVTSSSVVLVTLTSNPGPVVVQYVSLQPQVGFTVHLTAPAAMKTSFNYIILLGELF